MNRMAGGGHADRLRSCEGVERSCDAHVPAPHETRLKSNACLDQSACSGKCLMRVARDNGVLIRTRTLWKAKGSASGSSIYLLIGTIVPTYFSA